MPDSSVFSKMSANRQQQSNDNINSIANDLLNHYSDTPYNDIALNNPYARQLSGYKRSILDSLGDTFGFSTKADKLLNSAYEYDSQISQLDFENQYNSDVSKAARMREAGMNPDLLGVSGSSESSAFDMSQTSPDLSSDFQQFSGFASTIMSVVGMSFDVASKFIGLQDMVSSLDQKDLSNAASSLGIADHLQRTFLGTGTDIKSISFDKRSSTFGSVDENGKFLPFLRVPVNRRNFKRISNFLRSNGYDVNVQSSFFSGLRDSHKSRDEYIRNSSSEFSSPFTYLDNSNENSAFLRDMVEPLTALTDSLLKAQLKSGKADADYNIGYRSNLDSSAAAGADNAENLERTNKAKQNSDTLYTFRTILSNLQKTASDPKASAFDRACCNAALLILPIVLSKIGM